MTVEDTKTIRVRDGRATGLTLMLNKVSAEGHEALESEGFKGDYVLVTVLMPGTSKTSYDPFELERSHSGLQGNNPIFKLLRWLQNDHESFDEIEDDGEYGPEEIEELTDGLYDSE